MTNPPPPEPENTVPEKTAPENSGRSRVPYWRRYLRADGTWVPSMADAGPPGEELADLRSGLGQPVGSVMALWPYYATETDGALTPELEAEHGAVTLYGLHQQGQRRPMHRRHVGLGQALRRLRDSEKFLEKALDRRVEAAATTTSVPALLYRLRGLVTQLRGQSVPLDYDLLMRDLLMWMEPEPRKWVRSRWGLGYYARGGQGGTGSRDAAAAARVSQDASDVPPGN
ncbi:type I-E CRISPR-associated protein Cse2/CasB [Streptomyces longispororuber]|uniref:type I-E CRISPR-associated protein Cse2/CasB n=1 Tax=Streptomyces longispororuber TaxID=68230 RepID=UPI001E585AED|nr:type I-E CRISPR-associated protein Cse2/CasB [Streptomyces longispororuber]